MKKQKGLLRRIGAMVLILSMVFTLAPSTAFARGTEGTGVRNGVETVAGDSSYNEETAEAQTTAETTAAETIAQTEAETTAAETTAAETAEETTEAQTTAAET